MKFINVKTCASKEQLLQMLADNERVSGGVRFEGLKGTPHIHLKCITDEKVRIKCEYKDVATKDNGFLVGTVMRGKITEENGVTALKGFVTTSLLFHTLFVALVIGLMIFTLARGVFTPIPLIVLVFDLFMYKDEFKKQGIIKRYVERAVRRLEQKK